MFTLHNVYFCIKYVFYIANAYVHTLVGYSNAATIPYLLLNTRHARPKPK